jgi:hypothetical protein
MRADKRSAEARSPGSFGLVPTCQRKAAPYETRQEEPWYAPLAGAVACFAAQKQAVAPATKIEGGGWG